MYRHYFSQDIVPANLAKLTEQYVWRTALDIDREHNLDQKGDARWGGGSHSQIKRDLEVIRLKFKLVLIFKFKLVLIFPTLMWYFFLKHLKGFGFQKSPFYF